jgi:Putative zinc- or iron-chelating domain
MMAGFSSLHWSLLTNGQTDVPCNGCTECCRSNQGLFLQPEQGDQVESYRHRVLRDQATGNPVFLLATEANGQCVYLGASGCTIYDRRPLLCRNFDCRKHYLILPRQDRDNLVRLGLSSRAVFNAGRARLKSMSSGEREECLGKREEFFS